MKELVEELSTEYFNVSYSINQGDAGVWTAESLIKRKDTGEEVPGGCVRYGNNKEKVEKEVYDTMKQSTFFLSEPPSDWNSKTRIILSRHNSLGRRITNLSILISNFDGKDDKRQMITDKYFDLCSDLTSNTILIIKEIESLTVNERAELLTSSDDVYDDPLDPWNLDDLTSRSEIFQYFIKPSKDEIKAHELHDNKFKRAIDEENA